MEQNWIKKGMDSDRDKVHIILVIVQMEFLQFFHRLPINYYSTLQKNIIHALVHIIFSTKEEKQNYACHLPVDIHRIINFLKRNMHPSSILKMIVLPGSPFFPQNAVETLVTVGNEIIL